MLPRQYGSVVDSMPGVPVNSEILMFSTVPDNEGGRTVSELILSVAIGGWTSDVGWAGTVLWDDITIE